MIESVECKHCGAIVSRGTPDDEIKRHASGRCKGRASFGERVWARDLLAQPKSRLSPTVKCVALAFMLCVDYRTLEGYAGVEALAKQTGYSRRVTGASLDTLRGQGWLTRTASSQHLAGLAAEHRLTWPKWHSRHDD